MEESKIFEIIQSLRKNDLSDIQLSILFKQCSRIAYHCIFKKFDKIKDQIDFTGLTVEDLAVDSIAELFIKNKVNGNLEIKNSLLRWTTPIKNEVHAQFFLYKVVTQKVEHSLITMFKKLDPVFEKILKSVNYISYKNNYKKRNYLGTVYLIKKIKSYPGRRFITTEQFIEISGTFFNGKVEAALEKIFDYLETETDFIPAIPQNEFIRLHKSVFLIEQRDLDVEYEDNFPGKLDLEELVNEELKNVFAKIENYYIVNKILTSNEAECMKLALKDIAADLLEGGITRGLFIYIEPYLKNISKDKNESKYLSILDYLFWLLKKNISEEILKEQQISKYQDIRFTY